jgi:hypothetical protein
MPQLIHIEHTVDSDFDGTYWVYAADVNGDGYMDVLGAANTGNDITWWENDDGSGTSWTEHMVDGNFGSPRSVYAEDVNGDGYMDVLGAASLDDEITWWENNDGSGTSWTEHTVDGDFHSAWSVYAEDVDGDGYMDVLGAAGMANDITWWENNDGSGTSWTEHTVDGNCSGASSVYAEDVNGDGYMDVLGAAPNDYDIIWWENNDGSGTSWTEHTVDGNFADAVRVYAEDVDGDGYMDVLGAGSGDHDITWWENYDGSGTSWTEHTVDGNFDGPFSVYAEDVDGDGYMDVLATCIQGFGGEITWWENDDGSGTSWTEHTVDADFGGPSSVYAEDFDGNGHMDVLGGAFYSDSISWWDPGFATEASLVSSILDIQESPKWQYIDWTCTEPENTSIAFQVRASDDPDNMGVWSDSIYSPDSLSGILSEGDSLFQYKAILMTDDPHTTPALQDVTINWELLPGVQGETTQPTNGFLFHGTLPNPAFGTAVLSFALPVDSRAKLTIYDLTGRVVSHTEDHYPAGTHQVRLEDLASGVYLVRMRAGEFRATRRFVVIE